MKFSEDFLIGAATAAHQVEGNNIHSDYWAQEQMKYTSFAEPSGIACDHYHRYEEDIRLLAEAGLNAYRFSIEWARIQPEKDRFDEKEVEHYREVIRCCKKYKVTPIVTMFHFTSPKWLIEEGGWEAESTVGYFRDYCTYVIKKLGSELNYVCTINEANMGIQVAAIAERYKRQMMAAMAHGQKAQGTREGEMEPGEIGVGERKTQEAAPKRLEAAAKTAAKKQEGTVQVGLNMEAMMARQKEQAAENMKVFGTATPQTFVSARTPEGDLLVMKAHEAARDAMKQECPHLKIGLTLSLHDIQVPKEFAEDEKAKENAEKEWNDEFRHYLSFIQKDDFLGVQNYTRSLIGPDGILPNPEGAETTQMGYEFYPEALAHVIRRVHSEFSGDLLVTENGIATAEDSRREAFIETALEGIAGCVKDGIPVKGYMYWSLLDNFEWQKGYSMTFGLVSVDRNTQKRTPKKSLEILGHIGV